MAVPASRAVTAEELFALPDDDCRRELVDDTLTGGDLLPGFRCAVRRLFP